MSKDNALAVEITASIRINVLLEEYRALYQLAVLRLNALERRAPAIGATMLGVLSAVGSLDPTAQITLLLALPLLVLWYLHGTITHARSFEDSLRAIERIEKRVNKEAGCTLLQFQSRHPSRGTRVGGRTGATTTGAVLTACSALLFGCGAMWLQLDLPQRNAYGFLLVFDVVLGAAMAQQYYSYRYRPRRK